MGAPSTVDILRAKAEKKIGIIYGFQNAAMGGKDASRVAELRAVCEGCLGRLT